MAWTKYHSEKKIIQEVRVSSTWNPVFGMQQRAAPSMERAGMGSLRGEAKARRHCSTTSTVGTAHSSCYSQSQSTTALVAFDESSWRSRPPPSPTRAKGTHTRRSAACVCAAARPGRHAAHHQLGHHTATIYPHHHHHSSSKATQRNRPTAPPPSI